MGITVELAEAEDELSFAVMERLFRHCGRPFHVTLPRIERGFGNIKRSLDKVRNASSVLPHVVVTDLDNAECAVTLMKSWGAVNLPKRMMFRVAVRETEAWLLADRHAFGAFAGVPLAKIPQAPDMLADPKQTLINLIRDPAQALCNSPSLERTVGRLHQFMR
ncbi:hypothetical protein GCM10023165_13510 [Variovorax defluvii]|uniref:DUF4276 family protein n=1 Tax=Variovorax defluvii TaxID=913761 RepID=A0ABP8H9N3_9BURK